jgi:copper chaperone
MRTEILNVTGMTCGGCTNAVASALKATKGVKEVAVDLQQRQATIQFDESMASADDLRLAVKRAGFGVADLAGHARRGSCCGNR